MKYLRNHRFYNALNPSSGREPEIWDRQIAKSTSFVAIPSWGSIVPGWVLIVPRRKVISSAAMTAQETEEFFEFREEIVQLIASKFWYPTVFEHGAGAKGSLMGCGVDQAHIHIVPLAFDLIEAVRADTQSKIEWQDFDDERRVYSLLRTGQDYMIITPPSGNPIVSTRFTPITQYIRKVIATHTGFGDCWDYRSYSFDDNVRETLGRLCGT